MWGEQMNEHERDRFQVVSARGDYVESMSEMISARLYTNPFLDSEQPQT